MESEIMYDQIWKNAKYNNSTNWLESLNLSRMEWRNSRSFFIQFDVNPQRYGKFSTFCAREPKNFELLRWSVQFMRMQTHEICRIKRAPINRAKWCASYELHGMIYEIFDLDPRNKISNHDKFMSKAIGEAVFWASTPWILWSNV